MRSPDCEPGAGHACTGCDCTCHEQVGLTGFGEALVQAGRLLPDEPRHRDPVPAPVKRPPRRYRPAAEVKADLDRAEGRAADLTARVEKQRAHGARMISAATYAAMYDRARQARYRAAILRRTHENALRRESHA